jgi:hypothetical protein
MATLKNYIHMKLITKEDLQRLASLKCNNCVSIYIPTHTHGKEVNNGKDIINFKTELQKVKNFLRDGGMHENDVTEYLEPAYNLLEDGSFWHHQWEGLAVFLGENFFEYYTLPIKFEPFSLVSNSLHLQQILPVMHGDGHYYILALDLGQCRFYRASKYSMVELSLPDDVPDDLEESIKHTDFERSLQHHSGNGATSSSRNVVFRGVFHGQAKGMKRDERKIFVGEYLRKVQNGVSKMLNDEEAPLVLFGVEYLHSLYKSNNKYRNLIEKGIFGHLSEVSENELREKTWELVEPIFNSLKEQRYNKFNQLAGTGQTSENLEEIVKEASNGRVEALFVKKGLHKWGHYHEEDYKVEVHNNFHENDECLVSRSAVETVLNGGETYLVDEEEMPEMANNGDIVAVFRY